jgi:adenylylsulfate kinase-like enzyme
MAAANAAPLIWINGFPGSGKRTVAMAVAKLHENAILQDNHKLINPVEAKMSRSHPDYQKERKLQRELAFEQYVCDPAMFSSMIIFTG